MADKEKKAAQDSEVEKAATEESKAAAKVAKAAKGADKKSGKAKSPAKDGKVKDFFKHFKGETKKIVWPDAKTVFKSAGIVILVVAVSAVIIFGIDWCLSAGVTGLKHLATGGETTTAAATDDDHDHDHDHDEETTAAEETSKKSDEKATSEGTTAEKETETAAGEQTAKAE